MKVFDYMVVGSGCSGAMSAQTLVEAGKEVLMVDAGEKQEEFAESIPDKAYLDIRKTEAGQHRYFIGKNADGVAWDDIGKGAQVTPPRRHMVNRVEDYMPVESNNFSPLESLGYGGLGIAWGLQCWEYSRAEVTSIGLNPERVFSAYETVAGRIGISASKDGAADYTLGKLCSYQPSPKMDRNHRRIYEKYARHEDRWQKRGLYMGRTPLALITQRLHGRKAYDYKDMDYYSDNDLSAWRPWITVTQLKKDKNFAYEGGLLVTRFRETADCVEVICLDIEDGQEKRFRCRKLILGAGTMSSGRIVLRSLGKPGDRLPLLCNPYTYIPCVQPAFFGREAEAKKLGFAQLSLFLDEGHDNFGSSVASLYSYQSLMMFRTIRQLPLDFQDSRQLLQYLMSGLVIMGVHHPDSPSKDKYIELIKDRSLPTGDKLKAEYGLKPEEGSEINRREKKLVRTMAKLGAYSIKKIHPGFGASIHYAGTLPFSREDKRLTLAPNGRLHGTSAVYVADSSGFNYLPAKGLTFTLMANAHIIASEAMKDG